ncbi:DUF1015 domain-containing protein [Treponema parvum]|uniref:DUF1015 domain-containing protein n=1 Tax=Treponema parvum TaxID=138851 RepID=A0A975F2T0_9SPIR|nr:DUF1015 domain-containing protein [Treponema parvum]QTQ13338.1 DUF1015 domain-containing protein [Treponema parvum]
MEILNKAGIFVPEILLPKNVDTKTWAVIACDQYTQNKDYWKKAKELACGKASTLNMILPEVYLDEPDKNARIQDIRRTMKDYLDNGVFAAPKKQFIYTERTTAFGRTRSGLVAAIDLETYDWKPGSKAPIRATEATIASRIPPRMEIRKGAPLEIPHIMLLVNDFEHIFIEEAGRRVKLSGKKPEYSGNLMQNGGSITGWGIDKAEDIQNIEKALKIIAQKNTDPQGSVFLFAVGDGNHSLATAKAVWEEYKKELYEKGVPEDEVINSRIRYALVEIVNIYDSGLTFEPIHRVLFNADPQKLILFLQNKLSGTVMECGSAKELKERVKDNSKGEHFGMVYTKEGEVKYLDIKTSFKDLLVAGLQPELDLFIGGETKKGIDITIDYIHGSDEVFSLGAKDGVVALLLPPVDKESFFKTIRDRGALPRKSFSMGEADEKRFYMECRRLF